MDDKKKIEEDIIKKIIEENTNDTEVKRKKYKDILFALVILLILFTASFWISMKFLNSTDNDDRAVINSLNSKYLNNNAMITLKTGENIDKSETLEKIKLELGLSGDVTKEVLVLNLEEKGYKLYNTENDNYIFVRNKEEALEANKYYIGEKDGYVAIYKTNAQGKLLLEKDEDVFVNRKTVEQLTEQDRKKLKDYLLVYDSKLEALEVVSELIS